MKRSMRLLALAVASLATGFYLGTPSAAQATDHNPGPNYTNCTNLKGWYVNQDETADQPEPTEAGLKFENKDLIHHQVGGIDLADMDKVAGTFVASKPGKVLFKVETTAPYSTIITTADGKFWSTAMTYDQEGGQGHPVAKYSDLVGKPTKPGKAQYTSASMVVTFGVGYAVTEGDTVVSSITFHGTTYDLTCHLATTTKPNPGGSSSSTGSPSTTKPNTTAPHSSSSSSSPAGGAVTGTSGTGSAADGGGGLPVTGPSIGLLAGGAALIIGTGAALLLAVRRRKMSFEA